MNIDQIDLQAMIDRYNRELMEQFFHNQPATSTPNIPTATSPFVADETNDTYTDIGQLQVRVSIENQAVPIPGAVITITDKQNGNNNLIRTIITNESGLTPFIDLPTKDRLLTLAPGNEDPYAVYTVDVTANGYFPKRFINLPIYGGVSAVQNVSMVPLPENGADDMVLSYPQSGPIGL